MRAAGQQIDEAGQDVDEISCGSTAEAACPTRSTVWVSDRDPRCGLKDAGKLDGSRHPCPEPPLHVPRLIRPGHWLPPAADACQCATGCKVHDLQRKGGNPLGRPHLRGSRTTYVDNYFLLWWYFLWQFAQSTTHFRISSRIIVLLKAQFTATGTPCASWSSDY